MPEIENVRGDALCLKIEKEGAMHYAQKLRRRG
jgi:hypothetical protein